MCREGEKITVEERIVRIIFNMGKEYKIFKVDEKGVKEIGKK